MGLNQQNSDCKPYIIIMVVVVIISLNIIFFSPLRTFDISKSQLLFLPKNFLLFFITLSFQEELLCIIAVIAP